MIPLHVNWSEELRQLLLERRVQVEGIKIPDWPHCQLAAMEVARSVPVEIQVHFAFYTSEGPSSNHDLIRCWGHLQTTETKIVNTHFRVPKDLLADGRLEESKLMSTAFAHVEQLVNRFGREAVVIEHVPESEHLAATGCYAALLCRLVRETGIGLLLDTSHARLSARRHGCSPEEYIERLPMDHLRVIHTTGIGQDSDGSWVDHLPMEDRDYEILTSVLDGARAGRYPMPSAVQHEYGGISGFMKRHSSAEVLEREVAALRPLLASERQAQC